MTSSEYDRITFEREKAKDNYELTLQKKKLIADVKTEYNKEMGKIYSIQSESRIKRFFKKLFKVL
jgi:hypothetical protein